ncbi:MAG: ABC transporter permease [Ardenticatenaceae bacterium]|nr:ABC transporter permease [Ardenticatenaceae bacterium]
MTFWHLILQLFQGALFIGLLAATIRMATPLVIAGLGQIFTQLAGVLDLSVEGVMLVGAFFGFAGAYFMGNVWIGVLTGMASGAIVSLLLSFLSVTLRANQTIVSIMLVIMLTGVVNFANKLIFGVGYIPPKTAGFAALHFPLLSDLPVVGPVLFQQNLLVYIGFLLVPIVSIIIYRTTFGLKIRAVGEHPRAADSVGINVYRTQYLAIMIGGLFAGLGGAFLTLAWTGLFTDIITAGRGWLAIALVFFGKWNPYRLAAGALLFGFVNAVQLRMQAMAGQMVAFQLMLMLPYLLAIVVLIMVARKAGGPANLCVPYKRE